MNIFEDPKVIERKVQISREESGSSGESVKREV
jgi:hypothetical protein